MWYLLLQMRMRNRHAVSTKHSNLKPFQFLVLVVFYYKYAYVLDNLFQNRKERPCFLPFNFHFLLSFLLTRNINASTKTIARILCYMYWTKSKCTFVSRSDAKQKSVITKYWVLEWISNEFQAWTAHWFPRSTVQKQDKKKS